MYSFVLLDSGFMDFASAFKKEDLTFFKCLKNHNFNEYKLENINCKINQEKEHKIFILNEVTTTFDIAHNLHSLGIMQEWDFVVAHSQNFGRGQIRSKWLSLPGNLYCSLKLPYDKRFLHDEGTILLGQYLVQAFKELGINLTQKIVNDLLLTKNNELYKVVGILLEERNSALIVGFGVNVNYAPDAKDLDKKLVKYPPAKLMDISTKFDDPLELGLALVEKMQAIYNSSNY